MIIDDFDFITMIRHPEKSPMKPLPNFLKLDRFNISPEDVTRAAFHCEPGEIHPDVILMPWWRLEIFEPWADRISTITEDLLYDLEYDGKAVSVIRSGIGAPQAGDAVLSLGCTPCQRILFAGSVGGLSPAFSIGDLAVPDVAISGDGYCRYLEPGFPPKDCFLERCTPDENLSQAVMRAACPLAQEAGIPLHIGAVYSIDTILAQFGKLEDIANGLGCIGIEMETAAVFKAARMVDIQAAALLSVSDLPLQKKSLYAGRPLEEREHRREIRRTVLSRALLDCL